MKWQRVLFFIYSFFSKKENSFGIKQKTWAAPAAESYSESLFWKDSIMWENYEPIEQSETIAFVIKGRRKRSLATAIPLLFFFFLIQL